MDAVLLYLQIAGAAMAVLGAIVPAWLGIGWIVKKTKTKWDNKIYDELDKRE